MLQARQASLKWTRTDGLVTPALQKDLRSGKRAGWGRARVHLNSPPNLTQLSVNIQGNGGPGPGGLTHTWVPGIPGPEAEGTSGQWAGGLRCGDSSPAGRSCICWTSRLRATAGAGARGEGAPVGAAAGARRCRQHRCAEGSCPACGAAPAGTGRREEAATRMAGMARGGAWGRSSGPGPVLPQLHLRPQGCEDPWGDP